MVQFLPSLPSDADNAAVYVAISRVPSGFVKALELADWALLGNLAFWSRLGLVVLVKRKANRAIAAPAG